MHLFLVRHGETEHNRQNLALGQDDVSLNETGLRHAEPLGRALSEERLSVVYASPLARARCPAAAIAKPSGPAVVLEAALIVTDVGVMGGPTCARRRSPVGTAVERQREWKTHVGARD